MSPEFRILQNINFRYEVYYVYKKATFFKKEILKPYLTYSGLDKVYPFMNLEIAVEELKKEVIKNTKLI